MNGATDRTTGLANMRSQRDQVVFKTGKPRQRSALVYKSITAQKQQVCTSIFCGIVLPVGILLVLAIISVLGGLLYNVYGAMGLNEPRVLCSSLSVTDKLGVPHWRGIPVTEFDRRFPSDNIDPDDKTLSPLRRVVHTNWAQTPTTRDGQDIFLGMFKPCTSWYGEDYPQKPGQTYDFPSNATGNAIRDSTYAFQPKGGWFSILSRFNPLSVNPALVPNPEVRLETFYIFRALQKRSWFLVSHDPSVDPALIGSKPKTPAVPYADFQKQPSGPAFTPVSSANTTSSRPGLLGTIPTRYYLDFNPFVQPAVQSNITSVPWYVPASSPDAMDDTIYAALEEARLGIAKVEKSGFADLFKFPNTFFQTNLKTESLLSSLPHGSIYFKRIDHVKREYTFTLSAGDNRVLSIVQNFPGATDRQLLQLTQLNNAILRNSNPERLGNASITQGLRVMPRLVESAFDAHIGDIRGSYLYPFALSFMLPMFVVELVVEKESKILMMMKMNGLSTRAYYLSHYITFYTVYTISALIVTIGGGIAGLSLFKMTNVTLLFVLLLLWGHIQVSLAFLFTSLFNRTRLALLSVFVLVICSVMVSISFDTAVSDRPLASYYFLWPPFAFYRALGTMNRASYDVTKTPYSWEKLVPGDDVYTAFMYMLVQVPVILALAGYLTVVLPSEFGVRQPWHFPITAFFKKSDKTATAGVKTAATADHAIAVNPEEIQEEDADVVAERARVDSNGFDPASPLVIRHLRKLYPSRAGAGPKLAVKDATFAVEEGIVFGLLGPNGAGKSTIISMLTGLYSATSGTASLGGFDIQTQSSEVYKSIGICPQFNILWGYLSVEQHLRFYARLKGIAAEDEDMAVDQAIADVELRDQRYTNTWDLSGGQKRRVSIAIALLGNPKVVFLDEPTTGLDPEVRRQIWNIVERTKKDKTIVLTTHSMEEAEALCQRIGIMAKGTLRCLASPDRLKKAYGSGYRLHFNAVEGSTSRACAFVESLLPEGWAQIDVFAAAALYEFSASKGMLSKLFKAVEAGKEEHGILDWGVGQSTLEDVFVRLISEEDANAD